MGEEAGAGGVRGCDIAEGEDAGTEGALAAFARRLSELRAAAQAPRTAAEWRALLARAFERNLDPKGDERGADAVRKALDRIEELAAECGCEEEAVGFDVVKEQLREQLEAVRVGANLEGNAIQINELRPGSSTPRRVQVVMGLESGQFPGGESRAAYDLMRSGAGRKGRMGDRNPTRESRAAFLESLMSAGERLVLAYPAWSERDLSEKPASGPLMELEEHLERGGKEAGAGVRIVAHKLHGYSPEYFQGKEGLVSHSAGDRAAAEVLERRRRGGGEEEEEEAGPAADTAPAAWPEGEAVVDVEEIVRYFRNPAKAHWEGMGVYWRPSEDGAGDSEAFGLDALQDFQLKAAGMVALQANGEGAADGAVEAAVAEAYGRMQEAGDAPLGRERERLVEETAGQLKGMPEAWSRSREKETLLKALWTKCRPVNAETVVSAGGREVRVTGTLSVGEDGIQALARCANPKAKVRMEMWVKHLLGVASGTVKRTCVAQVGKSGRKRDDWSAAELDAEAAKRELGGWVAAYLEWRGRAAPFSPEASQACAEGRDAAKVLGAWEEDFDGGEDVYQVREFGARGPMGREGFGELAGRLMGPLAKGKAR
jgi:exonuclease V gamma subunit